MSWRFSGAAAMRPPAMPCLAQTPDGLDPTERLFDSLPFDRADVVARMTGSAAVDGRLAVGLFCETCGVQLRSRQSATNSPVSPKAEALAVANLQDDLPLSENSVQVAPSVSGNVTEVPVKAGIPKSYVGRVLRLTLLAPEIVEAILKGRQPVALDRLLLGFPLEWREQRTMISEERSPPNHVGR
jgi:hypothetical protein